MSFYSIRSILIFLSLTLSVNLCKAAVADQRVAYLIIDQKIAQQINAVALDIARTTLENGLEEQGISPLTHTEVLKVRANTKIRGILYYGMSPPTISGRLGLHITVSNPNATDEEVTNFVDRNQKGQILITVRGARLFGRHIALELDIRPKGTLGAVEAEKIQGIIHRLFPPPPPGAQPHISVAQISDITHGERVPLVIDTRLLAARFLRHFFEPASRERLLDYLKILNEDRIDNGNDANLSGEQRSIISNIIREYLRNILNGLPISTAITEGLGNNVFYSQIVGGTVVEHTAEQVWDDITQARINRLPRDMRQGNQGPVIAFTSPQQIDRIIAGSQTLGEMRDALEPVIMSLFGAYSPAEQVEIAGRLARFPLLSYIKHPQIIVAYINALTQRVLGNQPYQTHPQFPGHGSKNLIKVSGYVRG